MLDIELLLGRGKASDARWRQFLAREVTPRFPDGLTVYETYGQWRDPKRNVIVRERSRVLRIIVPADAPAQDKIDGGRRGLQEAVQPEIGRHRHAAGLRVVLRLSEDRKTASATFGDVSSRRRRRSTTVSSVLDSAGGGCCCFDGLIRCLLRARGGTGASAAGLPLFIVFPFTCPVSRAHSPGSSKGSDGSC